MVVSNIVYCSVMMVLCKYLGAIISLVAMTRRYPVMIISTVVITSNNHNNSLKFYSNTFDLTTSC